MNSSVIFKRTAAVGSIVSLSITPSVGSDLSFAPPLHAFWGEPDPSYNADQVHSGSSDRIVLRLPVETALTRYLETLLADDEAWTDSFESHVPDVSGTPSVALTAVDDLSSRWAAEELDFWIN